MTAWPKAHGRQVNANVFVSTVRVGANLVFALEQLFAYEFSSTLAFGIITFALNLTAMAFSPTRAWLCRKRTFLTDVNAKN